jgi:hypothetical protein
MTNTILNEPMARVARRGRRKKKRDDKLSKDAFGDPVEPPLPKKAKTSTTTSESRSQSSMSPMKSVIKKNVRIANGKHSRKSNSTNTIQQKYDELDFKPSIGFIDIKSSESSTPNPNLRSPRQIRTTIPRKVSTTKSAALNKQRRKHDGPDSDNDCNGHRVGLATMATPTGTDFNTALELNVDPHATMTHDGRSSDIPRHAIHVAHREQTLNRYAVVVDTRFLNTEEGQANFKEFQTGVAEFLYSTSFRPGLVPVAVAWTTFGNRHHACSSSTSIGTSLSSAGRERTFSTQSLTRNKQMIMTTTTTPIRRQQNKVVVHSSVASAARCRGNKRRPTEKSSVVVHYESTSVTDDDSDSDQNIIRRIAFQFLSNTPAMTAAVPITPPINNDKKVNRDVISLPKALMAHASWEYYGDLGKLFFYFLLLHLHGCYNTFCACELTFGRVR